jgi:hypothetical protein
MKPMCDEKTRHPGRRSDGCASLRRQNTGLPCRSRAVTGKRRCRMHGGKSTGRERQRGSSAAAELAGFTEAIRESRSRRAGSLIWGHRRRKGEARARGSTRQRGSSTQRSCTFPLSSVGGSASVTPAAMLLPIMTSLTIRSMSYEMGSATSWVTRDDQ